MKRLDITNSTKHALVDDEDYDRISIRSWGAYGSHTVRICTTCTPQISLANFIMRTRGLMYDHRDRNPFNNQKENLRITTNQLNQANRSKDEFLKKTTSEYKGVSWHKASKCWRAYITIKDKHISLGYFSLEENAARAYDEAAKKYFGEFACLNFPKEVKK